MLVYDKHAMCFTNRVCAVQQTAREQDRHRQRLREIEQGSSRRGPSFCTRASSDPWLARQAAPPRNTMRQVEREVEILRENQSAMARLRRIEEGARRERTIEQRLSTGRATPETAAVRERRQAQSALAEANAQQRQRIASAKPMIRLPRRH